MGSQSRPMGDEKRMIIFTDDMRVSKPYFSVRRCIPVREARGGLGLAKVLTLAKPFS